MMTFIVTVWLAARSHNRRLDEWFRRFEEQFAHLSRLEDIGSTRLPHIQLGIGTVEREVGTVVNVIDRVITAIELGR